MICVAEYNLGFDVIGEIALMHCFDRRHCADWHENRGQYVAMGGGYYLKLWRLNPRMCVEG